jgi:phosphofructokinase-like protein
MASVYSQGRAAPSRILAAMGRVGILTGGGDCPGLNAVIRAIVRRADRDPGWDCVGFRRGWAGVVESDCFELTRESTIGILARGGTILGTSRTNPYANGQDGTEAVRASMAAQGVDALIAIGGEDTLGVAGRLVDGGLDVVGVPKTIDNDLGGTEVTFGFHTAVQIATDAIDRLRTTAESHDRVMVVEVMGRHAGWIAAYAGIAGGADAILVPEWPYETAEVCELIRTRHAAGANYSIVVVSEGARAKDASGDTTAGAGVDAFGHARLGGVAVALSSQIEQATGFETRYTILGHVQRGGTPTAYDRVLATRFGVAAMDAVHEGRFGEMVALRADEIVLVPLADALREPKVLDPRLFDLASVFFG